jgi:hypothetical protein
LTACNSVFGGVYYSKPTFPTFASWPEWLTLDFLTSAMALDITIRIPDSDRTGFMQKLLRLFPAVSVISEKRTDTETVAVKNKSEAIDPNMLFGKWADFATDGRTLRRESWRREGF